jgi:hypothetical protein
LDSRIDSLLGGTKSTGQEKVYSCPNQCGQKLYVNYAKGLYFCVKCGFDKSFYPGKFVGRGSIESLYKYFKVNDYSPAPVQSKYVEEPFSEVYFRKLLNTVFKQDGLLEKDHLDYLISRGFKSNSLNCISSNLAQKFLLKNYSTEELIKVKFLKPDKKTASWLTPGKILLPYYEYGIVTGVRARSMVENPQFKYIWANNNKAAQRIYNHDLLISEKIVIWTEGEFKAARATECGYPTIATPGVGIGHENLAFNLARYGTKFVYVCFDTETKSSKSEADVNKAYKRASTLLSYLDIPHKRIHIPSENNSKIDLDTYINIYGPEALGKLFPILTSRNRLLHRSTS